MIKTEAELESLSAEEIRALAIADGIETLDDANKQPRDEQGKFIASEDVLDNPDEGEGDDAESEPDEFLTEPIEVDLGDGSGVQIFIGRGDSEIAALRDQNAKLKVAQTNATKKIREQAAELKKFHAAETQATADDEFVTAENFKANPVKTVADIVAASLAKRDAAAREETNRNAAWIADQNRFISTHPEFVVGPENSARIMHEIARLNAGYTLEGLEKAFGTLKAAGLVALKVVGASEVTEEENADPERIAPTSPSTPQPRSARKSSSVSGRKGAPVVRTQPTEDELAAKIRNMSQEEAREYLTNEMLKASPRD